MTARVTRRAKDRSTRLTAEAARLEAWDVADEGATAALLLARHGLRRLEVDRDATTVDMERLDRRKARAVVTMAVSGSRELVELAPERVEMSTIRYGLVRGVIELTREAETDTLQDWARQEMEALSGWVVLVNRSADAFCVKLKSVAREAVARRKATLAACGV